MQTLHCSYRQAVAAGHRRNNALSDRQPVFKDLPKFFPFQSLFSQKHYDKKGCGRISGHAWLDELLSPKRSFRQKASCVTGLGKGNQDWPHLHRCHGIQNNWDKHFTQRLRVLIAEAEKEEERKSSVKGRKKRFPAGI